MLKNTDTNLSSYCARLIQKETERRECSEDIKEIYTEMKASDCSKAQIAGAKLMVKRSFETAPKMQERLDAEEIAESLGAYAELPLGRAAIAAAQ